MWMSKLFVPYFLPQMYQINPGGPLAGLFEEDFCFFISSFGAKWLLSSSLLDEVFPSGALPGNVLLGEAFEVPLFPQLLR